jgi:hypothetical protein
MKIAIADDQGNSRAEFHKDDTGWYVQTPSGLRRNDEITKAVLNLLSAARVPVLLLKP